MRVVVATTAEDPWAGQFWCAYQEGRGIPPSAVIFLRPKRRRALTRAAVEAVLLFGLPDAARVWAMARQLRHDLRRDPRSVFQGTARFRTLDSLNTAEGRAVLGEEAPDLLISAGAPEIFKPAVLRIPRLGALNVHNGRLPRYRGLFGTFWESYFGEVWGYTTIHAMAAKVDAGDVLVQAGVPLGRSLYSALVEKKAQGGRLLAWLTRHAAESGRLPAPRPGDDGIAEGYFGWPSFGDLIRYRLHVRPSGGSTELGESARPVTWPPEAALEIS